MHGQRPVRKISLNAGAIENPCPPSNPPPPPRDIIIRVKIHGVSPCRKRSRYVELAGLRYLGKQLSRKRQGFFFPFHFFSFLVLEKEATRQIFHEGEDRARNINGLRCNADN